MAKLIKHCDDAKVYMGTEDVKLNNSVNKILTYYDSHVGYAFWPSDELSTSTFNRM